MGPKIPFFRIPRGLAAMGVGAAAPTASTAAEDIACCPTGVFLVLEYDRHLCDDKRWSMASVKAVSVALREMENLGGRISWRIWVHSLGLFLRGSSHGSMDGTLSCGWLEAPVPFNYSDSRQLT